MKVVMIIAPENFRDEELLEPKDVLENANVEVTVASNGVDSAIGMLGAMVAVDMDYKDINVDDYEGIVFVGGSGASIYFDDLKAQELAKEFFNQGKVVSAICIAPSTLAHAGLLDGRKATCFASQEEDLKSHGAEYTGVPISIDGKIVTASGPTSATEFGQAILDLLE